MQVRVADCTGCGICLEYCNIGAISIENGVASIDNGVCVECRVCYRNKICPCGCLETTPLAPPGDVLKHVLSDPTVTSEGTGVPGRGTEESKTNDITGRFGRDCYGICIDMGRPGVGAYLRDVEKVSMAIAHAGVRFADPGESPLSALFTDSRSGKLREDVLDVHVLSVIIEGTCSREGFGRVLEAILKVEREIDTVFSLGIVSMPGDDNDEPLMETLDRYGIGRPARGKVNVGLGHPVLQG